METKTIYQAIASIMEDVEAIGKNKKNTQQGFMYRGIDDLYNELQPKFAKNKVFITSEVLDCTREERPSKSGGVLIWTILKVKFTFFTTDGSSVTSTMTGEAMDSGDKGANKAMSIALKYCLMQLLLIPTEELKKEDNDGHIADPAPKTSMHNHNTLGNSEKPLISNVGLKKAADRIEAGELDIYEKTLNAFTLENSQKEVFETVYHKAQKKFSQNKTAA